MSAFTFTVLAIGFFVLIRNHLVYGAGKRRIQEISALSNAEIDAGVYDLFKERYREFMDESYAKQLFDLTKWTYRQFYAPLPAAPSESEAA